MKLLKDFLINSLTEMGVEEEIALTFLNSFFYQNTHIQHLSFQNIEIFSSKFKFETRIQFYKYILSTIEHFRKNYEVHEKEFKIPENFIAKVEHHISILKSLCLSM